MAALIYRFGRLQQARCLPIAAVLARFGTLAVPVVAAICAQAAQAQGQTAVPATQPPATDSVPRQRALVATKKGKLEEIIVTATRRSEANAKVPLAIQALSSKTLAARTIIREADLQSAVPGLTIKTTNSQNQINYSIRGESVDGFSGAAPGVLPYLNDVARSSQTATVLYDLSNIQVLKGPQGTLFGRNDTGGAVLYNTTQPGQPYTGYVTIRVGNYGLNEYQGAVNVPVVADKINLRFAGDFTQENGYVKELKSGETLGDTDAKSGRVTLRVTPNADIVSSTVLQYSYNGGTELNPALYSYYAPGQTNHGIPLISTAAAIYGNETLAQELALQHAHGPYEESLPFIPYHRSHNLFMENTSTYQISPDILVKNIVSYNNQVTVSGGALSGAANGVDDLAVSLSNTDGSHYNIDTWSEELQLQGKAFDQQLKYIAGFYASDEQTYEDVPITVGLTLPHPIETFHYDFTTTDRTYGVFLQSTYDLSRLTSINGLSFTLGGREGWEGLYLSQGRPSIFYGFPDQVSHEVAPSWNIGVQYQLSPEEMLYFANRGSWRTGNFNGTTSPLNGSNAFGPEKIHDFEIGSKFSGKLYSRPVQFNVAAYYQIVRDQQHDVYLLLNGNPTSFTDNVPKARVQGFEMNGQALVTDWLTVGGSAAYTDGYFPNGGVNLFGQKVVFQAYEDTPRWNMEGFVQAALPAPERWGSMTVRSDLYYQTQTVFSGLYETIAPGTAIPAYALLGFRYDWNNVFASHFSLGAFAKNVLGRRYYTGGFPLGPELGYNTAEIGEPQTYGAELKYQF